MAVKRRRSGSKLGEDVVRARVLEGAARVFAERGVRDPGVDDLIRAAGVSRRTFYRAYAGKEEIALELYQLGTERLLDACRSALEREADPFLQVERCVDAHLATARAGPRLLFVLGGEAQRQESLLHARRLEVHRALADLLASRAASSFSVPPDPLLFRAILLTVEGLTRLVLEEGDGGNRVEPAALERARGVVLHVARSAIAGLLRAPVAARAPAKSRAARGKPTAKR